MLAAAFALANGEVELDRSIRQAPDFASIQRAIASSGIHDEVLETLVRDGQAATGKERDRVELQIRQHVAKLALLDAELPPDAGSRVKTIKSNPLYADQGDVSGSSWLAEALRRLGQRLNRSPDVPEIRAPQAPATSMQWMIPAMWVVLGLGILVLAFFALKFVRFQSRKRSKRAAILDDLEPDRTLDEWLAEADRLAALGEFRLAVRALYVACLLRLDEARIARFIKGETNWEHLWRIEASPDLPKGFEFRSATRAFDLVWYGHKVEGQSDVDAFRNWYGGLLRSLGARQ